MNRKLLITSTDLMMVQFLIPHVRNLSEKGWDITLACSDVGGRMDQIRDAVGDIPLIPVKLHRNPFHPGNLLGFLELRHLLNSGSFHIAWTNEPVMGAVTRLAAWGTGAKVLYLCHGFHFFRGCPWQNWLFYPAEWLLSFLTDLLVTVNREDHSRKLAARRRAYIHGIGVDESRLTVTGDLRRELDIGPDARLALCVGELNRNKNQATLLRAAARLKDPRLHVILCGKGARERYLRQLAQKLGIGERVHFLGYRRDMGSVYAGADLLVHPARREGLGLAVLEGAMMDLPVIARDIRGIRDYGKNLLKQGTPAAFAAAMKDPPKPLNREDLEPYLLAYVKTEIESLLNSL